jgi:hypothetical protein
MDSSSYPLISAEQQAWVSKCPPALRGRVADIIHERSCRGIDDDLHSLSFRIGREEELHQIMISELMGVPGIGSARARRIIQYYDPTTSRSYPNRSDWLASWLALHDRLLASPATLCQRDYAYYTNGSYLHYQGTVFNYKTVRSLREWISSWDQGSN